MPIGPGRYDALCSQVREQAQARAALVIILGGDQGSGFSVQSIGGDITFQLPDLLESVAAEIRQSLKEGRA